MAGLSRRNSYRRQTQPYSTPGAYNVRGEGVLESRGRGGSRPGLSKVCATDLGTSITGLYSVMSIDADGAQFYSLVVIADGSFYQIQGGVAASSDANITTYDGTSILTEDGDIIIFDSTVTSPSPVASTGAYSAYVRNGKLLLADSVLKEYDPTTGIVEDVTATGGTVPTAQPLVAVYNDRVFLSGANNLWYCSRQTDIRDWDYSADMGDIGRPVAGQLSIAGMHGNTPTALIPVDNRFLVFACVNSIWVLHGDPVTGRLQQVTPNVGVIAPEAWARTPDDTMVFMSNDGIYLWRIGSSSEPARFSDERIPEALKNLDTSENIITMEYDPTGKGVHLFITPSTGTGTHYWIDLDHKALWPVLLSSDHQPTAIAKSDSDSLPETVIGCRDGYIRKFDKDAVDDDGTDFTSHLIIGPFRVAGDDMHDAILAEVHGMLAHMDDDSRLTWSVVMDDTAEGVADKAVLCVDDYIAGNQVEGVADSGEWGSGRNTVDRTRCRGAWCAIWMRSEDHWSYEAISITSRQLGRLR
jgi:hypothetical protein